MKQTEKDAKRNALYSRLKLIEFAPKEDVGSDLKNWNFFGSRAKQRAYKLELERDNLEFDIEEFEKELKTKRKTREEQYGRLFLDNYELRESFTASLGIEQYKGGQLVPTKPYTRLQLEEKRFKSFFGNLR